MYIIIWCGVSTECGSNIGCVGPSDITRVFNVMLARCVYNNNNNVSSRGIYSERKVSCNNIHNVCVCIYVNVFGVSSFKLGGGAMRAPVP